MNKTLNLADVNVKIEKVTSLEIIIYFLFSLVLWFIFPKDFTFSDPVTYLTLAHNLQDVLSWNFDSPFDHRLGLIFLHWVSMQTLGVTTFSAYLPQIILFLVLVFSVFKRVQSRTERAYAFAILLLLFPQTITVFPDLGTAILMFIAIIILERRDSFTRGALFSAFVFSAFLFKETAIFIIPTFGFAIVEDFKSKRFSDTDLRTFYWGSALTGVVLLAAYLIFFQILTGDPLSRFRAADNYDHLWSHRSLKDLVDRVVIKPYDFILRYVGPSFVVALISCTYALSYTSKDRLMAFYFLSSLVLFIFFSVSFKIYSPLPLIDRMMAFLLPPLAVLAANVLPILSERSGGRFSGKVLTQNIFLGLAFLWCVTKIALDFDQAKGSHMHEIRQEIASALVTDPTTQLFFAEDRTPSMLNIYVGFDPLDRSRMHVCPSTEDLVKASNAFVFVDRKRAKFLTSAYGQKTCAPDLIGSAQGAGYETLVDDNEIFVARR